MEPAAAIAALVTPEGRRDPHPRAEATREHGPVVRVTDRLVAVVGYSECGLALRHPQLLVQDSKSHDRYYPGWRARSALRRFTDSVLYTNPPDHARLRRLMARAVPRPRACA